MRRRGKGMGARTTRGNANRHRGRLARDGVAITPACHQSEAFASASVGGDFALIASALADPSGLTFHLPLCMPRIFGVRDGKNVHG